MLSGELLSLPSTFTSLADFTYPEQQEPVPPVSMVSSHRPVGVLVSAWPAVAQVGSPELLMLLISPALSVSPRPQRTCLCR